MKLIGLSGRARSGKDQFFVTLKNTLTQKNVYRLAFADALKHEVWELVLKQFGIPMDVMSDDEVKAVFRPLLQWWGTDFRRKLKLPDRLTDLYGMKTFEGRDGYWIEQARETLERMNNLDCIVCICDVRFPNECEMIKDFGGTLVRIERPGLGKDDHHSSETALDTYEKWDHQLINDGSLQDYERMIELAIETMDL